MARRRINHSPRDTLAEMNFHYMGGCEATYERYCPCQHGSSCCDDDYCRCAEITDIKITNAPNISDIVAAYISAEKRDLDELEEYGLHRIFTINKLWDTASYEGQAEKDYYGEEFSGVFLTDPGVITAHIKEFLSLPSDKAQVEYLLVAEYGFLLDVVNDKKWSILEVPMDSVLFGQDSYHNKANRELVESYGENYKLPRGVCVRHGIKYRVIDGYHRLTSAKQLGLETVKILVGV